MTKKLLLGLLGFLLVVGIAGEFTPLAATIRGASPLIFVFFTALLLLYERPLNFGSWFCILLIGGIGFCAEYLGVRYGLLFGVYHYGMKLGPKLGGVPVVVSLLWIITSLSCHSMAGVFGRRTLFVGQSLYVRIFTFLRSIWRIVFASALMVGMDVLIEPMAIRLGFWTWENGKPPLQNYLGWGIVSLACQLCIVALVPRRTNAVAKELFFFLLVFFIVQNLIAYIL